MADVSVNYDALEKFATAQGQDATGSYSPAATKAAADIAMGSASLGADERFTEAAALKHAGDTSSTSAQNSLNDTFTQLSALAADARTAKMQYQAQDAVSAASSAAASSGISTAAGEIGA